MAQYIVDFVKRNVEVTLIMIFVGGVILAIADNRFASKEQVQELDKKIEIILVKLEAIEKSLSQRLDALEDRVNTNTSGLLRHIENPSHKN